MLHLWHMKFLPIILLFLGFTQAQTMPPFIKSAPTDPNHVVLSGLWKFMHVGENVKLSGETHEEKFDDKDWKMSALPGAWDIIDAPRGGMGLYRKTFNVPEDWKNKDAYLNLDHTQKNAQFWLNGKEIKADEPNVNSFLHDGENQITIQVTSEAKDEPIKTFSGFQSEVTIDFLAKGEKKAEPEAAKLKETKQEVKDGVFHLNGQPFCIKAVSRIPHNARLGRYQSPVEMKNELLQMRRANFNAVDESRYPVSDAYRKICDELDMLVINVKEKPWSEISSRAEIKVADFNSSSWKGWASHMPQLIVFDNWKEDGFVALEENPADKTKPKRYFTVAPQAGLVMPNGMANPIFEEIKKALQEIQTTLLNASASNVSLQIQNQNSQRPLNYVKASWKLLENGEPIKQGEISLPNIPAQKNASVTIPLGITPNPQKEYYFRVRYDLIEATAWHPAGMPIAWEEFALPSLGKIQAPTPNNASGKLTLTENEKEIIASNEHVKVTIDKTKHELTQIHADDADWLASPIPFKKISASKKSDAEIALTMSTDNQDIALHILGNNQLQLKAKNFSFEVPSRTPVIRWYGKGPHENTVSTFDGAWTAIHEGMLPLLFHRYNRPRLAGQRGEMRWFTLKSPMGGSELRIESATDDHFDLRVAPCNDETILQAKNSIYATTGTQFIHLTSRKEALNLLFTFSSTPIQKPQTVNRTPIPRKLPVLPKKEK